MLMMVLLLNIASDSDVFGCGLNVPGKGPSVDDQVATGGSSSDKFF